MMIEYQNVTISYWKWVVIKNLTAKIDGKVFIIGKNGSGKTTLIKATVGLLPYKGSIRIDGKEVREIKNYLGLSTNLGEVYNLGYGINNILDIYSEEMNVDKGLFSELLKEVDLDIDLKSPLFKLSTGQSLLLRNILAFSAKPRIILLDEPFENIDPARRSIVAEWIKKFGKEGIITTHNLDILSKFPDYKLYVLSDSSLYGPITVKDFLEASVIEGESEDAILILRVSGKKVSLVKGKEGMKIGLLGTIDRLYGV
ncbi:ATP-binding cassette domain-containing protein [Stygiolobus caldivivus]|nr:ATP-binding cassette domain-containing protein [Stygiolobus caldivivus]